jgi:hypothetical protein
VGAFWRIGSPVARAALVQPPESERVAVSHRVELSPFAAAEDGEVIALELHQDPDCSAAVGPTTFPVASAARLLAEPVSGRSAADTASSVGRAIRLRYPMEPARVPRRLYLRANGSHVTPFRVECQPQAASVPEDLPHALEWLPRADGKGSKWRRADAEWRCAGGDAARGLSCAIVSTTIAGLASLSTATAASPDGIGRTAGGHASVDRRRRGAGFAAERRHRLVLLGRGRRSVGDV